MYPSKSGYLETILTDFAVSIKDILVFYRTLSTNYFHNISDWFFHFLWSFTFMFQSMSTPVQRCISCLPHKSCLLTGKNIVQCCPEGSRLHCSGKKFCGGKNLAQYYSIGSRKHSPEKILFNIAFISLGKTLHR